MMRLITSTLLATLFASFLALTSWAEGRDPDDGTSAPVSDQPVAAKTTPVSTNPVLTKAEQQSLNGEDLRRVFIGHKMSTDEWGQKLTDDARIEGDLSGGGYYSGWWKIVDDQLCAEFPETPYYNWCGTATPLGGGRFVFKNEEGSVLHTVTVTKE